MILIVIGTSTSVGKTVVTAAVTSLANRDGRKVAVVNPASPEFYPMSPAT